jgi:hypothetical protein
MRAAGHTGVEKSLWCLKLIFLYYVRNMLHSFLHCLSATQPLGLNLWSKLCGTVDVSQALGHGCGGRKGSTFEGKEGRPSNSGLIDIHFVSNQHLGRNPRFLLILELFLILVKSICFSSVHGLAY